MNQGLATLRLLLSPLYSGDLAPEHLADLAKSGLTPETTATHAIRSIPPAMLRPLLGFDVPAIRSALLFPFPDPRGGWLDHVRVKVFPPLTDGAAHTTKYLGPRGAAPRLYVPRLTMDAVLRGSDPVWLVEGAKKALAVAQLGLPAVGFEGIEGWHVKGSLALLEDFGWVPLRGRRVELVPDGDVSTNPAVIRGARKLAEALEARGAQVRVRLLPMDWKEAA
jgi:hypothetical protein